MNFNSDNLLELESYLKLNHISKENICLVGSTTLSLIGVREHHDIDFVLHSKYKSPNLSSHSLIEQANNPWSTLFTDDELIENSTLHIIYNGFKFVIPELVYHKKIWHNRDKDKCDIFELKDGSWDIITANNDVLNYIEEDHLRSGITTLELDLIAEKYIVSKGAIPAFKGLYGFPGTLCISINDEVFVIISSENPLYHSILSVYFDHHWSS